MHQTENINPETTNEDTLYGRFTIPVIPRGSVGTNSITAQTQTKTMFLKDFLCGNSNTKQWLKDPVPSETATQPENRIIGFSSGNPLKTALTHSKPSELKINLLQEFMCPNVKSRNQEVNTAMNQSTNSQIQTLIEQNKSVFKKIAIDQSAKDSSEAQTSQKQQVNTGTFKTVLLNTFSHQTEAHASSAGPKAIRVIDQNQQNSNVKRSVSDKKSFKIFDDQIAMSNGHAISSPNWRADRTPTSQSNDTCDRIEDYSVVEASRVKSTVNKT